ncbi:MAG: hypothetical protein WA632_01195 [Gallionella sp.]
MGQEFKQDGRPNRQMAAQDVKAKYSLHTDIGEAKIVHTLSGKAKVIVVREQDKKRLGRLLMLLVATAIAAVSWVAWLAAVQNELERQNAANTPTADRVQVSEPAYLPEFVPSGANPANATDAPRTQLHSEISKLVARGRLNRPPLEEGVVAAQVAPVPAAATITSGTGKVPAIAKPQASKPEPNHRAIPPQSAIVPSASQAIRPAPATQSATQPVPVPSVVPEPQGMPIDTDVASTPRGEEYQSVESQSSSRQ